MGHLIGSNPMDRRTVLRGLGAALALPTLDAMLPAGRRTPERPVRSVFIFSPNGMKMEDWTPSSEGRGFALPYLLEPLAPIRERLLVISGLAIDGGFAKGDGPGDHARAAASFLTCAHPVKTGGADIRAGVSVDQELASVRGELTRFASLELGTEPGALSGACDSGYSCAYSNNISWRSPSTPNAKQTRPKDVLERLFGDPSDVRGEANRQRATKRRRWMLDAVAEDAKGLRGRLGIGDRRKLDEFLQAVRDLERRLSAESKVQAAEAPAGLVDRLERGDFVERLRLHYDLITLALETDQTRIVTFMLGNAGSNRTYRFLDVPEGHHTLSHHGNEPEKLDKIRRINRFHTEEFARFGAGLARVDDGGQPLLDRCQVLFGSGIGDGNRHNHDDLPLLVLGGVKGLGAGRHLRVKHRTPAANLYVSLLRNAGVPATSFADSTGALLS